MTGPGSDTVQRSGDASYAATLSPLLDDVFATVVAGTDSGEAAEIAVAVARAQAERRRVAVADLIGEAPALQALVRGDDPHGISDSFLYGVSLNKIARAANAAGTMFVMPSGTEPVAHESVYANDRWRRLAAGFHQVGALLLVVAAPGTPGFAELCGYVGSVMPVGSVTFPVPPGVRVIAPASAPATPTPLPTPRRNSTAHARAVAAENASSRNRRIVLVVLLLAAVGVLIGTQWTNIARYLPEPLASLGRRPDAPRSDTVTTPPPAAVPLAESTALTGLDSAQRDSAISADSARSAAALAPLEIANPGDSARAARFAVYYASANTREGAMPDERARGLPAIAMSPVPEGGEPWFRVTVGAATARSEADSLLAALRRAKIIGAGSIVIVPFALRLEDSVSAARAQSRIAAFGRQGIAAYALRQDDGTATILTGAFETAEQARPLVDSLTRAGLAPALIYRTGRTF